ncbi:MAG: DUF5615 family PIN-like protein [Verrucomicrobiota bacterium]
MRRVFFDENVPRPLVKLVTDATQFVSGINERNWKGIENGELLRLLIDEEWDVFVTADKNIRYQQNLAGRGIAIIELPTNRLPTLQSLAKEITDAIANIEQDGYVRPGVE